MIDKILIEDLVEEAIGDGDLFIVEISVSKNNKISVILDGDQGVSISRCVDVSRVIEGDLDREIEDFELSVSSYGIDQPFLMLRQYQKYIAKPIQLILEDDTVKRGELVSATSLKIVLKEEIIKKNRRSKKLLIGEPIDIEMDKIKLAKSLIVF